MNNAIKVFLLSLLVLQGFSSCKKKVDFEYDNRPNQTAISNSLTRLVNLIGYREIQIGDKRLSSFLQPDKEGSYGTPGTMRITPYFPTTGQLSTVFSIPSEFVGADGIVKDIQLSSFALKDYALPTKPFSVKDYGRAGMDYYLARFGNDFKDSMFAVPRDIANSSNPANFKIRILNLSTKSAAYGRKGKMTLAWADGTPVSANTTSIDVGDHSQYAELPFGTYQFKILCEDGREVPSKSFSGGFVTINILNPNTGTLMGAGEGTPGVAGYSDSWSTYAPLKTYQPGGIYTIVIANTGGYKEARPGSNGETTDIFTNCFQVVSDISEPINATYGRVQASNVVPGAEVKWLVDDKELGSTNYTQQTDYLTLIVGKYQVKAVDKTGKTLATTTLNLLAGDNVTTWLYTDRNGAAAIGVSNNNLSGVYNTVVNGNDGSYAALKDPFPTWIRFMNFSANLDDVTFTGNNGVMFNAEGSKNLSYATQKTNDVYVKQALNFSSNILVYASKPGVLPGNWIENVNPLPSTAFIKNIDLYKTPSKPNSEPGIYTVVLVGKANGTGDEKAKTILIKHNK